MKVNNDLNRIMRAAKCSFDVYRPAIERAFDVDLSGVKLSILQRRRRDYEKSAKKEFTPFQAKALSLIASAIDARDYLSAGGTYNEEFDTVYVNLLGAGTNKQPERLVRDLFGIELEINKLPIEQTVIHELAHAAFVRLEGERSLPHNAQRRYWGEGFAHYCADVGFRSLYQDVRILEDPIDKMCRDAKSSVARLVQEKGAEYLREIPKVWSELEIPEQGGRR